MANTTESVDSITVTEVSLNNNPQNGYNVDDGENASVAAAAALGDELGQHECIHCPYGVDPLSSTTLTKWQKFRGWLHLVLEEPNYNRLAKSWSLLIMFFIFVSTVAFCLETLPELKNDDGFFFVLETIVVVLFSLEYVLRIATSTNVIKFIVEPLNVIDLMAVLPYYIDQSVQSDSVQPLRIFRVVRLARVFRLFKISRYSSYVTIMMDAIRHSSDAFGLLVFFVMLAVVVFSTLEFYAERGTQDSNGKWIREDGEESPYTSIPATFYWCIVTMTTVGYGDIFPITVTGKVVASAAMICGILVIALPVTVLGSNFQEAYLLHQKQQESQKRVETDALDSALLKQIEGIRANRLRLDVALKEMRQLLQARAAASETDVDISQLWSITEFVVLNGMSRMEDFLEHYRLEPKRRSSFQINDTTPPREIHRTQSEVTPQEMVQPEMELPSMSRYNSGNQSAPVISKHDSGNSSYV